MTKPIALAPTLLLALAAGTALAAPEPAAPAANSWLYPRATFEDGRNRDTTGDVSATPDGMAVTGDPEDQGPRSLCFDQGSNPTKTQWEEIYSALQNGYESRYNLGGRWGGAVGDPVNLKWSFAPDGVLLPGLSGADSANVLWSRMDTLFGAANRATWISKFQAVFDRWSALTGVNYTRVTAAGVEWDDGAAWGTASGTTRGDVRIGMRNLDGASNVLAFNTFPTGGDMVMDSSESWNAAASNYIVLRNIVAHEHGHGLGLPHVCPISQTKLMEPFYSNAFDGPRLDDIRGVQHYYGDIYESNDTSATATDLGTLANGSTTTLGAIATPLVSGGSTVSLVPPSATVAGNEHDWYKFTLNTPQLVNFFITPVGTAAYTDVDQNGDGSCQTSGVTTDPLRQADPQFSVVGSNGTTVHYVGNANGLGVSESVTGLLVNTGVNFLDVTAQANFSQTQMYTVSITVQSASLAATASDGTFSDRVAISWPAVPNATGYKVLRATTNVQTSASTIATLGVVTNFDDTTAVSGTTYYYWIQAQQTGSTFFRYMTSAGEPGSRGVSNIPPTANAGTDQVVTDADNNGSESVTLVGSGSTDTDGVITNYLWQEGVTTLSNGATANPSVSLPWGLHTLTLTVTDNGGASTSDNVQVTINRRPVANAGPDQTVTDSDNSGSENVVLDATASSDPDGTLSTFVWKEGATTLASTATANVALAVGVHTLTLTVTDNRGATNSDTVIITVDAPPPPGCDPDVNQDGNVDQDDVSYLINVVGGGDNPTNIDPDFNHDGNVDQDDISSLINKIGGGPCP